MVAVAGVTMNRHSPEMSRDLWARSLSARPLLDAPLGSAGCVIRWFQDTQADIVQPPLNDNYVVLHLGGPKRVCRAKDGPTLVTDMGVDAVTIVPACAAYDWSTAGPIEYAHIYIPPKRLARAAETIFDRDGAQVRLRSEVGQHDPLMASIFHSLMDCAHRGGRDGLFLEVMTEAFLAQLLRGHANLSEGLRQRQYALSPKRLKDVAAHIDDHLDGDLTLDSLASIAGLSRYHFSRAFTRATGEAPHAFVMRRRLERAKCMLRQSSLSISEIAQRCGFAGAPHLSNYFLMKESLRPSAFRQNR
jgi:AraC family transcriptional regulator